jgi:hypothetical protein
MSRRNRAESKSDRRRVARLKVEMRRLRRSGRRRRRARENPESGGGFPWGKVAIGIGVAILIWRGPQIWRGVKGLFGAAPYVPRPATGGPSGPAQPKSSDDIPPPR